MILDTRPSRVSKAFDQGGASQNKGGPDPNLPGPQPLQNDHHPGATPYYPLTGSMQWQYVSTNLYASLSFGTNETSLLGLLFPPLQLSLILLT